MGYHNTRLVESESYFVYLSLDSAPSADTTHDNA